MSGRAHQVRESRPSDVVTNRIAAPFSTHGTERSMPPISTTNVCPAATKPTNEAVSRIAFTLAGAREAGVEDGADAEDEHHRAEGEDHAPPVGRQERRQLPQPARPRLGLRAHLTTPDEPADERAEDDGHDEEQALEGFLVERVDVREEEHVHDRASGRRRRRWRRWRCRGRRRS